MSIPWPSSIPQLKQMDELLRCGICYELMATSMVTACSHNYCSLCIRQYLSYKTQCPACFQETTTQHLRNNRLVDEIISLFSMLRDKVACLSQASKGGVITGYLEKNDCEVITKENFASVSSSKNSHASIATSATTPKRMGNTGQDRISLQKEFSPMKNFPFSPRTDKDISVTPKRSLGKNILSGQGSTPLRGSSSSGSTSKNQTNMKSPLGSSSASWMSTSQSPSAQSASGYFSILTHGTNASSEGSNQDGSRVPCPVCGVAVLERNINIHLDACLRRIEEGDVVEVHEQVLKRKPMAKLVYSLLSEKQLRQKLKDIGLPTQGDKQALMNRHRRFVTLYNAECDVLEPRPVSELLRQVEREEREKTRVSSSQSIFTYDRKTAPEVIEKEQQKYIKENRDHFAQLIADVQRRQTDQRKKRDSKAADTVENVKEANEQIVGNLTSKNIALKDILLDESDNIKSGVTESGEELKLSTNDGNENIVPMNTISTRPKKNNNLINSKRLTDRGNSDKVERNEILCTADQRRESTCDVVTVQEKEEVKYLSCLTEEQCMKPTQVSEQVKPSPDMFQCSPSSPCSNESESLLLDCEPLSPVYLSSLPSRLNEDNDEETIPSHQPEPCHEKDVEERGGTAPSPVVGRHSTRSKKATSCPDQSDLIVDTQLLSADSQGDPEYVPSKLSQTLEYEDVDFEVPKRKTRRSARKRTPSQEVMPSKKGKKKKKQ